MALDSTSVKAPVTKKVEVKKTEEKKAELMPWEEGYEG